MKFVYRCVLDNKIPAIRLENQTYRIPASAIIDYLKKIGYGYFPFTFFLSLHPESRPQQTAWILISGSG